MSQNSPEGAKDARRNMRLRIVSGIVLAVVVLAVTWIGGLIFYLFTLLLGLAILNEWMAMRSSDDGRRKLLFLIALIGVMVALSIGVAAPVILAVLAVLAVVALISGPACGDNGWAGAGLAYAGMPIVALAATRGDDAAGLWAILFLFAVVWATDILAYFVGRAIGGPKLAPSISPGKTWSGAAGGALGAVVAGGVVAWFGNTALSLLAICFLAFFLSVVSQLGDLFESGLKRRHGVKDSSTLIPGHGGVMDRVDGLIVAAVLFYLVGGILSGFDAPATGFFSR
ncbi:phosphatidate cytidylyltransferase [Chelativorans sp. YIM 93263]|uniref:phosphatidate cytidylyltransferase n=1 Tax=Chelativorans sp. YIM 93263 TaxID=2906648 RepID=UPI002379780B|nr:phosphatidate cytidylyltransferase [Chelativorans sp. YIM 93263]